MQKVLLLHKGGGNPSTAVAVPLPLHKGGKQK